MSYKIVILLAMLVTLPGCVPVVFVAGAATGLVVHDQRAPKTIFSDRTLTIKLQHVLDKDAVLSAAQLSVTVFDGIVLVVGQVPGSYEKERINELLSQRVRVLYNEVTIGQIRSKSTQAKDAWITTKAKTQLITIRGLNSFSLRVTTECGVVYLMGITTQRGGHLAAEQVSGISGVQKVVKLFEYVE